MSNGSSAGSAIGEGLKGAWNTFNGAGEAIRGNINGALDGAGNAIVNKDADSTASAAHHDAAVSRDQATASKGEAQVRAGLDKILK